MHARRTSLNTANKNTTIFSKYDIISRWGDTTRCRGGVGGGVKTFFVQLGVWEEFYFFFFLL